MQIIRQVINKIARSIAWFIHASLLKKGIILAILLGIGWFGVRPLILSTQQEQVQYQTSQAEKGTLITSVTASGTVSSGNSASITTDASGIVKEVYVKNGDTVSAGQPIALLSLDTSSQQQQTQAWASYLSAQNSLNSAKSKMNSLQASLFQANQNFVTDKGTSDPDTADPQYIIERANWLQAEADYNNQANVITQAEAALSSAWLSYSLVSPTITAPMSGVVSNITLTPGMSIAKNSSSSNSSTSTSSTQSLGTITLADGKPQASVNLTEIDITKVTIGQKVTLTLDAFPNQTFTGVVSAIDTQGTTSSGVTSYPVTITFDTNVDKLYPNMAVNATIITKVKNNVLIVPSSAVQTSNGETTVRVMNNGQVTTKTVEIGDTNDSQTEIVSGLTAGDTVVTGQTGGTTSTQSSSPFSENSRFGGGRVFGR